MFVLPTFNLAVNIWRSTNNTANPPNVETEGNLAWSHRHDSPVFVISPITSIPNLMDLYLQAMISMHLLLPPLTDIRGPLNAPGADVVEVPAGSGRYYFVAGVDDIGKGFDNEHRVAIIVQGAFSWPTPLP